MISEIVKSYANGAPLRCKFCHQLVWFNPVTVRYLEPDSTTPHVNNCPRRQAFYREKGIASAQSRRERRAT